MATQLEKVIGFNPNQVTFDEGLKRIQTAVKKIGLDVSKKILTSHDPQAEEARQLLMVTNVPGGFTKWQLPVYLDKASQLFITVAAPGARVGEHSHNEGAGIRFIAGGSIKYKGQELSAGDWMYIPAGVKYSFETGKLGAIMCYCYCCSCAGRADLFDQISNPPQVLGA
jgi:hypothetical protein